jgi:hypothetical protein
VVALFLLGAGAWFYRSRHIQTNPTQSSRVENDVPPGTSEMAAGISAELPGGSKTQQAWEVPPGQQIPQELAAGRVCPSDLKQQ